jgi:hypothetical protein
MLIPEKVRIGSCDYEVILTDKPILREGQQCYGHIDLEHREIEIDNTLQDIQGQEITLLHEIAHGIIYERDLKLQDEEFIVHELAKALHQIIRDNPIMFLNEDDIEFVEEETQ